MLGLNKAPIVDGLESVFMRVLAGIAPKSLGRGEIIGVIFQNPLTNADGTSNTSELFVGNGTNLIWFMIPGQESPVIYAEDLKDVYVKLNFPATNPNGAILTLAISASARGAGYAIGNVLTLDPGTTGTNATLTVDTVDGSGGILTFTLNTPGLGFTAGQVVQPSGGAPSEVANFIISTVETVVEETCDVVCMVYRCRKGGRQ